MHQQKQDSSSVASLVVISLVKVEMWFSQFVLRPHVGQMIKGSNELMGGSLSKYVAILTSLVTVVEGI